ncbi:MAG: lytic transglycosylase domain-containing protein [Bdellovibrionales bacterium]
MKLLFVFASSLIYFSAFSAVPKNFEFKKPVNLKEKVNTELPDTIKNFKNYPTINLRDRTSSGVAIDIPISYNKQVKKWIVFFQTRGKRWFSTWLSRSHKYLPDIQTRLRKANLPLDLAYIAMIESGFSSRAVSTANAVGPWQFIEPTGKRFNLQINDWIDERQDFQKSTDAAIKYLSTLYSEFENWYLVAAAYNTGEGRVRRLIRKYKSKDFWYLSRKKGFVKETRDYIPKWIAATLIAKSPSMYGFEKVHPQVPSSYEYFFAPGGTDLLKLADHLNITHQAIINLNPALKQARIPRYIAGYLIRVPKNSSHYVSNFIDRRVAQN